MKMSKRVRPADFGASAGPDLADSSIARDFDPAFDVFKDSPEPALEVPPAPSPARAEVASISSLTAVQRAEPAHPPMAPDAFRPPPGWPIYLVALAVAVLWALAPIASAVG